MAYTSVVRIYATTLRPDFDNPWQSRTPSSGTGSGVVVGPGRILTGAHVIADATFVQVQKVADPKKYVADVAAVCHDADLAMLVVDDPAFMSGVEPEQLGGLPDLRDRVSVVGYPVGGEEISITEGVVSRVEVQRYSHSRRRLLAVTVDAAINDGNSGGPVLKDGKVVGIAFQTLRNAENIGEMVPAPLIEHFLRGIEAPLVGRVGGPPVALQLPELGVKIQTLDNPLLFERSGLSPDDSGVLVRAVEYGSSCWGALRIGDALLAIDGQPIANNGTVQYLGRYRTACSAVLGEHYVGDVVPVTILRDGRRLQVPLALKPAMSLVPRPQYDDTPSFVIYGGLVFQLLTLDFLRTWKDWWENAPAELLHHYYSGMRTPERQQIIVLSQVLADEINVGFEGFHNESVLTIDGHTPASMHDFVARLDRATDVVEIKLSSERVVVLDPAQVAERDASILRRYKITKARSAELERPPLSSRQPRGASDLGDGSVSRPAVSL